MNNCNFFKKILIKIPLYSGIKSKINMNDDDDEDTVSYDIYNEFTYRPDLTLPLTGDEILTLLHPFIVVGFLVGVSLKFVDSTDI